LAARIELNWATCWLITGRASPATKSWPSPASAAISADWRVVNAARTLSSTWPLWRAWGRMVVGGMWKISPS
jgi:hypothetical protein